MVDLVTLETFEFSQTLFRIFMNDAINFIQNLPEINENFPQNSTNLTQNLRTYNFLKIFLTYILLKITYRLKFYLWFAQNFYKFLGNSSTIFKSSQTSFEISTNLTRIFYLRFTQHFPQFSY